MLLGAVDVTFLHQQRSQTVVDQGGEVAVAMAEGFRKNLGIGFQRLTEHAPGLLHIPDIVENARYAAGVPFR